MKIKLATQEQLETLKEDYTNQRQQDQFKVATVEKELNDYKSTMANVNVNQEVKQKVSGYGSVSLPKNAANGQVSVSVKGETYTNLLGEQGLTKRNIGRAGETFAKFNLNKLTPLKTYTLYAKVSNFVGTFAAYVSLDSGFTVKSSFKSNGIHKIILSTPINFDNTKQLWVYFTYSAYDAGSRADIEKIMILEGDYTNRNIEYVSGTKSTISASRVKSESLDKTQESLMYIPNVGELRSLPNGTKDEIKVSGGKAELVKRVSETMEELAEPITTPIKVSGTLLSNPSGTVYVENVVADAGVYDSGINVLHQDLPIDYVEKLSKVDFTTGLEMELDISKVVVSEDRKSFTHPNLVDGDILFFTYFHNIEGTEGELSMEYYDSRHVLKDTVTGKFYKIVQTVTDGVLTDTLVEV